MNALLPGEPMNDEKMASTPTPESIKKAMEGHMRVVECGKQLHYLATELGKFCGMLTANNPILGLAVANQLHLNYDEVLRRNLQVVDQSDSPPGAPGADQETGNGTSVSPHGDSADQS